MQFLGKLGIDIKLLIAQMINFGLLLWLLAKFVYKPIINRIEKEEQELERAQEQSEALEKEKESFAKEKKTEIDAAKKQVREIIKEAKIIAKAIKEESRSKTDKEIGGLIAQAKVKLQSNGLSFRRKILTEITYGLKDKFQKSLRENIPLSVKEIFQEKIFFADLLRQLEELSLKYVRLADLTKSLKELRGRAKREAMPQKEYNFEAQKILNDLIGPVVLEYALSPSKKQKTKIKKNVFKKFSALSGTTKRYKKEIQTMLEERRNESLISGFRLEIAGNLIESNLSQLFSNNLEYVIETKK